MAAQTKAKLAGRQPPPLLLLTPSPIPASSVYCFPNIVNIRSLIEMQIRFKWLRNNGIGGDDEADVSGLALIVC